MREAVCLILGFLFGLTFNKITHITNEVTATCPKCPEIPKNEMPKTLVSALDTCESLVVKYISMIERGQIEINACEESVLSYRRELDQCMNDNNKRSD
jgi:hypothetical protein